MHIQTSTATQTIAFAAGIVALGVLGGHLTGIREELGSDERPAISQPGTSGRDLLDDVLDDRPCAGAAAAATRVPCLHSRRELSLPGDAPASADATGQALAWMPLAIARSAATDSQ